MYKIQKSINTLRFHYQLLTNKNCITLIGRISSVNKFWDQIVHKNTIKNCYQ